MRNPFRRRRKLPGAESEWNEREHIAVGDDYVAIPADQLSAEAVERLEGVELIGDPEGGGHGVLVDVIAVEAEVVQRVAGMEAAGREPTEDNVRRLTVESMNNTAHWKNIGDGLADDDTPRYSIMRINLVTGRIGD